MKKEFWPVIVGGVVGGVFWYFAQMVAGKANLVFGFEVMIYALFGGVIAAFINVYTLSDLDVADSKNTGKVVANALIAAVAFPSIISSAVAVREASDAAETKQLEKEAIEESNELTDPNSFDDKSVSELGSEIRALKQKADSGALSVQAAKQIDSDLQKMLDPLKKRAESDPGQASEITKIIGEIGKDKASNTSKVATEKLAELQDNDDAQIKAAATVELKEVTESYVSKDAIEKVEAAEAIAPIRSRNGPPS